MKEFFISQIDYIFFIYGLSFILLFMSVQNLKKLPVNGIDWHWLGVFGLIHGALEWTDLIAYSFGDSEPFLYFRLLLMVVSFLPLIEFARVNTKKRISPLIYAPLALIIAASAILLKPNEVNDIARYLMCLVGGVWAGVAIYQKAKDAETNGTLYMMVAICLVLYGLSAGFIVPKSALFPASIVNHDTFLSVFDTPIQLVRAFLAMSLAYLLWRVWRRVYIKQGSLFGVTPETGMDTMTAFMIVAIIFMGWLSANWSVYDIKQITQATDMALAIKQHRFVEIAKIALFVLIIANFFVFIQRRIASKLQMEISNKILEALLQVQNVGFIHIKNKKIIWASDSFEQMLGYERNQLIGEPSRIIYDNDEDYERYDDTLYQNIAQSGMFTGEIKHIKKNGSHVYLLTCVTPLKDRDRELVVVAIDITKQKELTEAIKAEKERYKTLMDLATDGVHVIDMNGEFIEFSDSYASMLGYTHEELEKLTIYDIEANMKPYETNETIKRVLHEPIIFETRHKRKDGSAVDVQVNAKGIELDGKKYVYASARDITKQKESERIIIQKSLELEKANEELRVFSETLVEQVEAEVALRMQTEYEKQKQEAILVQRSKMADMGDMLGAILHQWKQPLNAISILTDMLEDEWDTNGKMDKETFVDFKKRVRHQIDNMSKTAQLFKNFFSPSKEKTLFMPCEAIKQTTEILAPQLNTESIVIDIKEHEHFFTNGYKNEFMQVVLNIISNAKDVIKERGIKSGRIDVLFENDGVIGTIKIRDNGGGVPKELLPDKLFEPYVTTKGEKGTGIGLQLAKTIIETHLRGRLWAHNVEEGAEFVIELPIERSEG